MYSENYYLWRFHLDIKTALAEKLNEFFATMFTVESMRRVPRAESLFSRREYEEWSHAVVTRDDILDLLWKIKTNVSRYSWHTSKGS